MNMSLACTKYEVYREAGEPVRISVELFCNVNPNNSKLVAEALKKIELMLAEKIDLVKAAPDKARCFHCSVLNETDANICSQCGAPL